MTAPIKPPPKIARSILLIALPLRVRHAIVGDLIEEYQLRSTQHNNLSNNLWFWKQSLATSYEFINKQPGVTMAFIASILFFIGTVIMTFSLAGEISMFIDVPAFIITVPASILFGITCTSWQSCKLAIKISISEQDNVKPIDYEKSKAFLKITGNTGLLMGGLMVLLGWIAIGSNMEPEVFQEHFGPAFSVSILTLVYAMILKILCYVAEQRITLSPPVLALEN